MDSIIFLLEIAFPKDQHAPQSTLQDKQVIYQRAYGQYICLNISSVRTKMQHQINIIHLKSTFEHIRSSELCLYYVFQKIKIHYNAHVNEINHLSRPTHSQLNINPPHSIQHLSQTCSSPILVQLPKCISTVCNFSNKINTKRRQLQFVHQEMPELQTYQMIPKNTHTRQRYDNIPKRNIGECNRPISGRDINIIFFKWCKIYACLGNLSISAVGSSALGILFRIWTINACIKWDLCLLGIYFTFSRMLLKMHINHIFMRHKQIL